MPLRLTVATMHPSHKVIIAIVAIYLGIGVLFYAQHFSRELKTYECDGITIFNSSYQPPQENCKRRAFQFQEIGTAISTITLWLPLLVMRGIYGN